MTRLFQGGTTAQGLWMSIDTQVGTASPVGAGIPVFQVGASPQLFQVSTIIYMSQVS